MCRTFQLGELLYIYIYPDMGYAFLRPTYLEFGPGYLEYDIMVGVNIS